MAGYVTQYDVNDFTFLTVKGAGHMVESKLFLPAVIYSFRILNTGAKVQAKTSICNV